MRYPFSPRFASSAACLALAMMLGPQAHAQGADAARDKADGSLKQLVQRMNKVKSKSDPSRNCVFVDSDYRIAERNYNEGLTAATPDDAKRKFEESYAASQQGLKKPVPRNCQ